MNYLEKFVITRNGERYAAQQWVGPGGGGTQVLRKLGPDEAWPPPRATVQEQVTNLMSTNEQARLRDTALNALLGDGSHLGEKDKQDLAQQIRWQNEHGGR